MWLWLHEVGNWLWVHTGTGNEPGSYYGFWSGFGSDIGEVAIIGAVVGVFRKHNCVVKHCWRLSKYETAAGHKVCRKHHPDHPEEGLTYSKVQDAHKEAKDGGDI